MNLDIWALLALLSKFSLYACVASAIGGVFSLLLLAWHPQAAQRIPRYTRYGCIAGIFVAIFSLLVQVGTMVDRGVQGAFDVPTMSLILQTSVGKALLFEVTGFFLIGCSARRSMHRIARPLPSIIVSGIGCLILLASFSQVGHFAEASWIGKFAISLHILAMSMWIGSLYPLWFVSRTSAVYATQISMETFGRIAVLIVGVLIICGTIMGIHLVRDFHTLISTGYGQGLLLKIVLVVVLLLVAAGNKWLIVPHLNREGTAQRLSRAIQWEIVIASIIFLITAVITVIIGIDSEAS